MKITIKKPTLSFNVKNKVSEILIVLFLLATMWARIFTHSDQALSIASILLTLAGLVGLLQITMDKYASAFIYILFMVISWLPGFLFKEGGTFYTLTDLINSIFFFGIAYMIKSDQMNYKIFKILYYVVAGFFFIQISILHNPIRGLLADGNTYNYISCILILYFCIYVCIAMKNGKNPTYIDSVLLVVVIISSYGRGGIVTALIYVAGFALIKAHENKAKLRVYIIIIILIGAAFFFSNAIIQYLVSNNTFGKFLEYGLDSNGRSNIWITYIKNSIENFGNFFLGSNPRELTIDGNLHNSFLQMWTTMGIVFCMINIYLLFRCIFKVVKERNYYYLLIIVTFLVRAFFDKMMFRWYGEILMYFFILDLLLPDMKKDNNDLVEQSY